MGLTQRELAERSQVSLRTVRYIELGQVARPQASSVRRLADALGLTPDDLERPTAPAPAVPRVGVLGALVLWRDGVPVPIASSLVRTLLGLLAVQVGRPVGDEEIIDVLWGEDPPRTCAQLVHTYIASLRRLLEPGRPRRAAASVLRRTGTGYLLEPGPDGTDLGTVRRLTGEADRARLAGDEARACELTGQALAIWRGAPLAGCGQRLDQHPAVVALRAERITLALAHADLALACGAPSPAGVLRALLAEEPLHETLAARLMLALAADGQQAGALAVFDELRRRLDTELGLRPGTEVRTAHLQVLRGQPAVPAAPAGREAAALPAPAQLPADVAGFTGRDEYLTRLDRQLSGDRPVLAISTVDGMPGVGKTALAVHWAHRVRDRFPDGQLYADLRGHANTGPARPVEALVGFLLALGVAAEAIPDDLNQAASLYRSTVAGKRLLVVLDNAVAADQVRPLLPGTTGSVVLVTSRVRIAGLVARDGATQVTLGVLTRHEAVALLRRILGDARADAEAQALARLAELCAYLPLALRIAAANLVARPRHRIADHVTRLAAGNRLAMLSVDGDAQTAVRATFDLSYAALSEPDRRTFRLIGTAPGPDTGLELVAALSGDPASECEQRLARLVDRNLVDEPSPGRYTMHDLIRLYATERCHGPEREQATDAIARYYVDTADTASRAIDPHLLRPPATDPAPAQPGYPEGQALAWLDRECDNLFATVAYLAAAGRYAAVCRLADALQAYLRRRVNPAAWQTVCATWLAAARALDDPTARAAAELSTAVMHNFHSRYEDTTTHLHAALDLAGQAGWTECEAVALNNLARMHWLAGRTQETIDHFQRALPLHRKAGRVAGEAVTLANLGAAYSELARSDGAGVPVTHPDLDTAAGYLHEALALHRQIGDRHNEAETLRLLAEVHRDLGDHPKARTLAGTALQLAHATEDQRFQVTALATMASIEAHCGHPDHAAERYQQALHLARTLHDQQLEVKSLLEAAETELVLIHPERARALVDQARPGIDELGLATLAYRAQRILDTAALIP
jgi:DNA-binding SARP family transcriptional activator